MNTDKTPGTTLPLSVFSPALPADREGIGSRTERKRTAAYIRVSTEAESQENSFALQARYFTSLIEGNPDWIPAGIYFDCGLTGTDSVKRIGFQRLLRHCAEGRIDQIVCKSVSRFARNAADFLTALEILKRSGVSILFEREGLNTAEPCSSFLLSALAAVAQEESRSISANIRKGNAMRFPRGDVPNEILYGYRFTGGMVTTASGYRYRDIEPVPEQAEIVRRIFRAAADGARYVDIARALNREGIPAPENDYTRNRRTKAAPGRLRSDLDESWCGQTVSNLIRNERYTGDVLVQKTWTPDYLTHKKKKNRGELAQYLVQDHHPAIVSRGLFDAANAAAAGHQQRKPHRPGRPRPFSGRVVCAACGRFYRVRNVKHYPIWFCPSAGYDGRTLCTAEPLYEEQLVRIVRRGAAERFAGEAGEAADAAIIRSLTSVLDADNAERDCAWLRRRIGAGCAPAADHLARLEEYRRALEKDQPLRREALGRLMSGVGSCKAFLLDMISEEYPGAFVLSLTVHSPYFCTVRWFDDSTTEVRMDTNVQDHRRNRTCAAHRQG